MYLPGRSEIYGSKCSPCVPNGVPVCLPSQYNSLLINQTSRRDRMLHSALNFAVGFFGLPIEGKYLQSVTIEEDGVCLTTSLISLAPKM